MRTLYPFTLLSPPPPPKAPSVTSMIVRTKRGPSRGFVIQVVLVYFEFQSTYGNDHFPLLKTETVYQTVIN